MLSHSIRILQQAEVDGRLETGRRGQEHREQDLWKSVSLILNTLLNNNGCAKGCSKDGIPATWDEGEKEEEEKEKGHQALQNVGSLSPPPLLPPVPHHYHHHHPPALRD